MKRIILSPMLSILALIAAACTSSPAAPETVLERSSSSGVATLSGSSALSPRVRSQPQADEDARVVADLIDLARRDNHVQDHLRHLCLAIGPRLTSSHNLATAQQWTIDQFRGWGLDANLERWGEFPVGFDRGPFRGGIVGDESVQFEFTTSSWSAGTKGPVRGRALFKPENEEQFVALKEQLAGAWLVTRASAGGGTRGGGGGPPGAGGDNSAREKLNAAIAAAGIAGEIRSAGRNLVITSGNHQVKWDSLPKNVRVTLRDDQHKDLVARIEKGDAVELEFDIDNRFYAGPVPQYNVIADIKGSEFPDEYVIVGGHLDSWDGAQGAVDNGTGCATTLEAARLLMSVGAQPKRTIRFALWSGEEQGLFGSEGYVRDHKDDLGKISAVYIHDGGTNYLSGLGVTFDMEAQMRKVCAPIFELNAELPFKLRVTEGLQYSSDSDHAPFSNAGVPGFFWDQSGKSDYNHMHHTQHDTFETAVPEYQEHSALVAALVAFNTANLPERLSRENFKALPSRRLDFALDGAKLRSVTAGGIAEKAGWKKDDLIVSIEGVAVATRREFSAELQKGGAKKLVVLRRGEETIETTLDYSASPDEEKRSQRAAQRAARKQAEQDLRASLLSAEQKKFW